MLINGENKKGNIKIFNPFGKLVYENSIVGVQNELPIDVSQLANGIYTVVVYNSNIVQNKKLIIQE